MANPSTMVGILWATVNATTVEGSIALDPKKRYSIAHSGRENTGAASTVDVFLAVEAATEVDSLERGDKIILTSGTSVPLLGVGQFKFRTAAGNANLLVAVTG